MAETLWNGGPQLEQQPGVFPMGTDSILLAAFSQPGPRDRVLDLGTGTGILPLLLLYDRPGLRAVALEQDEAACRLAARNFHINGLQDRIILQQGDLRDHRSLLAPGSFDFTISNPPYFPTGSGHAAGSGLEFARGDGLCTLEDLCTAAAWATRWGGRFTLVFRPDRLAALFSALTQAGFQPKRLRPVHHNVGAPVNLLLLEARRGGNPGLTWEPDLYLYEPDGQETPELRSIYRRP
jgi:tRNA1(Val) A37 N6-methylase TrmN6